MRPPGPVTSLKNDRFVRQQLRSFRRRQLALMSGGHADPHAYTRDAACELLKGQLIVLAQLLVVYVGPMRTQREQHTSRSVELILKCLAGIMLGL